MRFRFCGGLEPPDWLLAEIALLTTLDTKRITDACLKLAHDHDEADQSLEGAFTGNDDAAAAIAVLRFVLFQAAKYNVVDRELAMELLQLGVTSEAAEAIAAVYNSERGSMRKHLESRSFKFPTIEQLHWRVHANTADHGLPSKSSRVELRLQLDREALLCTHPPDAKPLGESLNVMMTEDKFLALYEELSQAQTILQSLSR